MHPSPANSAADLLETEHVSGAAAFAGGRATTFAARDVAAAFEAQ
jgi:hypothetical protein